MSGDRPTAARRLPIAIATGLVCGLLAGLILLPVLAGPSSAGRPSRAATADVQPAASSTTAGAALPSDPSETTTRTPALGESTSAIELAGWEGVSYVPPSDALVYEAAAARVGPDASPAELARAAGSLRTQWQSQAYHGPAPERHAAFRARERAVVSALEQGLPPSAAFDARGAVLPEMAGAGEMTAEAPDALDAPDIEGTLRLFVVAVEFAGEDTVEEFSHPVSQIDRTCVTDTMTTYTGPLHNTIPEPSPMDNETFWLPNFDQDFYEKIILSEEGIEERPRPDLIDPEDGQPGIDFSGLTMANYYDEVSGGKVRFDAGPAGVMAWVQVPHSVAYYAANRCDEGDAGRIQSMNGLPDNPRYPNGVSTLAADVVDAINEADPDFPWQDYDTDDDNEIDHVILIHAGIDKSDGGGEYGWQQIWAHRGSVDGRQGGYLADDGGTPDDPSDDVRLRGYTIQPENLYLGVVVHEFGHDLGLPDLYDTSGAGRNSVAWWEQMSLGARTGRLNGSDPTHLSSWSKMVLDWGEPRVITPTEDAEEFVLGQASGPPEGTEPALMIEIPPAVEPDIRLLPGSTQVWSSGSDQNWADVKLDRELDLGDLDPGTPVSLTFDLAYEIHNNRDFFFVEVSADGGQTYTQTRGYDADSGEERTTSEDYDDPADRLERYGNLRFGYTDDSSGWLRVRHDLSPWAGQSIHLRLRYATDNFGLGYGAYVDNIRVDAGAGLLFEDLVENDDEMGWTRQGGSFENTQGDGWRLSDAARRYPRYYILEWRSTHGFDLGLKYAYNTIYSRQTPEGRRELRVDHIPTNAPGLLAWVWDTRFGSNNNTFSNSRFRGLPSEGAKGGLMVVDAHPEPLRGPLGGKIQNEYGRFDFPPENNWDGRVLTADAAFNLRTTPEITLTAASGTEMAETTILTATLQGGLPAVRAFHDALGHTAGVELLPAPITLEDDGERQRIKRYAFSDPDGGLVIPAAGYYAPRTPEGFSGLGAETSPPSADVSTEETMYVDRAGQIYTISVGIADEQEVSGQHSGNPGDSGLHFGFHFEVVEEAEDGSQATVRIWRNPWAAELEPTTLFSWIDGVDGSLDSLGIQPSIRNVGGAGRLLFYADFDERSAMVPASRGEGMVPVGMPAEDLLEALRENGADTLPGLAVSPEETVGVAWLGHIPSGDRRAPQYSLEPRAGASLLRIRHLVYALDGGSAALAVEDFDFELGSTVYLPGLWNQAGVR